ncbi:diacylglycerol/lipid kinase family protein [Herbiconiux ginsengi]|uniref:Diacylglycerol kinase family enzyme n=1 Tax=Herbiconiux ginsengi TaxID=381665 RepID=A0A1H3LSE1_9MICO|nr:diacylglycerol kinase family protein [Herbiconiux ginsengi]SDY67246.1 Diacylglycerol kinase family enzyme [Herbiconiux ginsengi]
MTQDEAARSTAPEAASTSQGDGEAAKRPHRNMSRGAGQGPATPEEAARSTAPEAANTAAAPAPRAAVVVNPVKVDASRLRPVVAAAEKAAGWAETLWFETTLDDAGERIAREAVARGAAVVVAAGGDGTVRAVAEGLRDTGVPIGLLPVGTGNLLARNLDLTLTNVEQAVTAVFTGHDRRIDVGVIDVTREDDSVEEKVFLVMAGLGIDAKMIAKTNKKLKKAVGWLAYVDGIGRAIPELKPVKLRFRLDGSSWKTTSVHTVIVGNCGLLPGGLLLIPDARPDDGVLDIVALRPEGPFGWLRVWNKIAFENGVLRKSAVGRKVIDLNNDVRSVSYSTGRDFELTLDGVEEIQLDGDEWGMARAVHTWVDPGALLVRVPADSKAVTAA